MTPFHFDRNRSSLRIGVDPTAPKEFVDKLRELGAVTTSPHDRIAGRRARAESSAAFDEYVQMKAKEPGSTSRRFRAAGGAGPRRWWSGRGAADSTGGVRGAGGAAGGGGGGGRRRWSRRRRKPDRHGRPHAGPADDSCARLSSFRQRRRQILITQMAEPPRTLIAHVPGAMMSGTRADRTSVRCGAVQVRLAARRAWWRRTWRSDRYTRRSADGNGL